MYHSLSRSRPQVYKTSCECPPARSSITHNQIQPTTTTRTTLQPTTNKANNDNMCYWTFVTSDGCAFVIDRDTGRRRMRTKDEGFLAHGSWRLRTSPPSNPCQAQRTRAHCDVPRPKYKDVVNPRKPHLQWDQDTHWTRDPATGDRVPDTRCEPCRHESNRRAR